MIEALDALMRTAEELTDLMVSKSMKVAAQSAAMDTQSVQMTEQSVKLAELQGAREDARTLRQRETSPPLGAGQGACSVSSSRKNAPQVQRRITQYPMWRKRTCIDFTSLCLAVAQRLHVGLFQSSSVKERVMSSELRGQQSTPDVDEAIYALGPLRWKGLFFLR